MTTKKRDGDGKKPPKTKKPKRAKKETTENAATPSVPEGYPKDLNMDAAFHRKAKRAKHALHVPITTVFEQVLGEWDQDDESTVAHLLGLQEALAFALGAVHGHLLSVFENPILPAQSLHEAMLQGRQVSLVASFRGEEREKRQKEKAEALPADVIALPVVRKT